jgi:chemotaxis response regulator CheB
MSFEEPAVGRTPNSGFSVIVIGASAGGVEPHERGPNYVAPPDHHLLAKRGHLRVVHGPRKTDRGEAPVEGVSS